MIIKEIRKRISLKILNIVSVLVVLSALVVPALPSIVRAATYNIAASNSSSGNKSSATAICSGTDDQNTINTYLTAGNTVNLYAGTYNINGLIVLATGNTLVGQGNTTILNYQNSVGGIYIGGVSNITVGSFEIIGNADPSYGLIVGLDGSSSQSGFYFHDIKDMALGGDDFAIYANNGTISNVTFVRCDANNPDGWGFILNGNGTPSVINNVVFYSCTVENAGVAATRENPWVVGFDLAEYNSITVNGVYVEKCTVNGAWESDFHIEAAPTVTDVVFTGCNATYAGLKTGGALYGAGFLFNNTQDVILNNNTASHNANGDIGAFNGSTYDYMSIQNKIYPSSSTKVATTIAQGNCSGVAIRTSANHYELVLYSSDGNAVSQTITLPNGNTYSVSFTNYGVEYNVIGSGTTPPSVTTVSYSASITSAVLNGNLTNLGSSTSVGVSFNYGLTASYGLVANVISSPMTTTGAFTATITGLAASTTYHFQAVAVGSGTITGYDMSFTTSAVAPPYGTGTYSWYTPITVKDTTGTDRTEVPVLLSIKGSDLHTQGYISSSGLNTNMQLNGVDTAYQINTVKVPVIIPTLNSRQSQTVTLFMGYSPVQTAFPIIVGNGGYITTADNAALEPSTSFLIDTSGYIDTTHATFAAGNTLTNGTGVVTGSPITLNNGSNTVNGTVWGNFSIVLQNGVAGTVTQTSNCNIVGSPLGIGGTTLLNVGYAGTPTNTNEASYDTDYSLGYLGNSITRSFTLAANSVITSVSFYLFKYGNPTGAITANIRKTSDGSLIGTLGTMDATSLLPYYAYFAFNGTVNIGNTTGIDISLEYSTGNASNHLWVGADSNTGLDYLMTYYPQVAYSFNITLTATKGIVNKASAVVIAIDGSTDGKINATLNATTISATSVTSGVHRIQVGLSGGTMSLQIDALTPVTIAFAGSVTNNTNNWIINQGAMPYMTYFKESVGGVEVLKYQPLTMVADTALIDTDNAHNGVITWGTNSGFDISYSGIQSYLSLVPQVNGSNGSVTNNVGETPSEKLNNDQSKLNKLPFIDIFSPNASDTDSTHPSGGGTNTGTNSGITLYGLYLLMGIAVVVAIGTWIAMLTGSKAVLLIALVAMMALFVQPLFSAWMVIALIIGGITILYLSRSGGL